MNQKEQLEKQKLIYEVSPPRKLTLSTYKSYICHYNGRTLRIQMFVTATSSRKGGSMESRAAK